MSNSVSTPSVNAPHWEPKFPFDLVVAYEDSQTRQRALHLYDHLAQQLLDDYDFQCSWWKFDHLTDASLRQEAADSATTANMIILCLHAGRGMPGALKPWIEDWLPRRDRRKAALVALFGGAEESRGTNEPALTYLRQVARQAHLDFFDHSFALSLPARRVTVQPRPGEPRVAPPATPPYLYHQVPTPRWGINE